LKIVVLNYTGDRKNWGCQATSKNMLLFLKEFITTPDKLEIETIALPIEIQLDRIYDKLFGDRIRDIYQTEIPQKEELDFLNFLVRERFGHNYKKCIDADVVVFQGEGSIGPSHHFRGVRLYGLPLIASLLWRKPVYSMNQTLYAVNQDDAKIIACIFRKFDLVALREMKSYSFASRIGIENIVLCPDFALREKQGNEKFLRSNEPYFCVTGSAALDSFRLKEYLDIIYKISILYQIKPIFIASRKKDHKLILAAKSHLKDISYDVMLTNELPHYENILPLLKNAFFVIGGRYHSALSALTQNVPVILLPGNTYKSEGIGDMLGLDIPVFSPHSESGIMNEVKEIMEDNEIKLIQIQAGVLRARNMQNEFGCFLDKLITHSLRPQPSPVQPTKNIVPKDKDNFSITHQKIYVLENIKKSKKIPKFAAVRLLIMRITYIYLKWNIRKSFINLP
jgi:polysaccharide pyruvyl transferase WcaK-like protein